MEKVNYLNVGCGNKFHRAWTNIDMVAADPAVRAANLIEGIPFDTGTFDVVYHSQVLEHIPKDNASAFLAECLRVLRPGGILRVVVPDMEDMAREYLRLLDQNLSNPSARSAADYDWIMLEMYDQVVRNHTGGAMADYLRQPAMVNEDYVVARIGKVATDLIRRTRQSQASRSDGWWSRLGRATPAKAGGWVRKKLLARWGSEALKVGSFRLGGEVHLWMYDRYSLARALGQAGFVDVSHVGPNTSAVPDWSRYELDVRGGAVVDPTSLFMEARRPLL